MTMKETLERGGLRVTEFAKVIGVNRVTASTWVNGRFQPHIFIRPKVEKVLALIDRAVEMGALPLDESIARSDRMAMLKKTLNTVLKQSPQ